MKKITLFLTLSFLASITYAQNTDTIQKKSGDGNNEIKINLLTSVLALPEINYERLLADNMGVGLALSFGVGNEDDFSEYKFLAIPHYRVYFGKKNAAGLFIEGNAALASVRDDDYTLYFNPMNNTYSSLNSNKSSFNFGLGAAIGAKFLTRNGFLGEIYAGAGRFLGNNRTIEAYPRLGITLGKRF